MTLIRPNWSVNSNIRGFTTTKEGGVSRFPYTGLNLGAHVGDEPSNVELNRQYIYQLAGFPNHPHYLNQTHSTRVAVIKNGVLDDCNADAVYTDEPEQICAILTADCLPVLFCAEHTGEVAAAHAGWRGLAQGILENTASLFKVHPREIKAWLGPAIGPNAFEVAEDVFEQFVSRDPWCAQAFNSIQSFPNNHPKKYLADLYKLARRRLNLIGISEVYGGEYCTATEQTMFYSYRRDGQTGRMLSAIWNSQS